MALNVETLLSMFTNDWGDQGQHKIVSYCHEYHDETTDFNLKQHSPLDDSVNDVLV